MPDRSEITLEDVPIDSIAVNPAIQQRARGIDPERVEYLLSVLVNGDQFKDRLTLFRPKKGRLILAGGFHRYSAYVRHGAETVPAEVHPGEYKDAMRFAYGDNRDHGVPRSKEDLHKAVVGVLTDPEYADRKIWSLRKIAAEVVFCDPSWLSRMARNILGTEPDEAKARGARASNKAQGHGPKEPEEREDGPAGSSSRQDASKTAGTDVPPLAGWGSALLGEEDYETPKDKIGCEIGDHIIAAFRSDPHAYARCLPCNKKHKRTCACCGGKGYVTESEYPDYLDRLEELGRQLDEAEPELSPLQRAMASREQFDEAAKLCRRLASVINDICHGYGGYFLRNIQTRRSDSCGHDEPLLRVRITDPKTSRSRYELPELISLLRALRAAKPKHACPDPRHRNGAFDHAECSSQGFVPESKVLRNRSDGGIELDMLGMFEAAWIDENFDEHWANTSQKAN